MTAGCWPCMQASGWFTLTVVLPASGTMKTITYKVIWKEMWSKDEATFDTEEEAKNFARMKKAMNYKEVALKKVETTEMEF